MSTTGQWPNDTPTAPDAVPPAALNTLSGQPSASVTGLLSEPSTAASGPSSEPLMNLSVQLWSTARGWHIALIKDVTQVFSEPVRFESRDLLDLIDTVHGWLEGRIPSNTERADHG